MIKAFAHKSASTLVEILVYFALLAVFLTAALSFAIQIINVSELSSRLYEIETQMDFVQEKIKSVVVSAEGVNTGSSVFDSDLGTLSLEMSDVSMNPSVFTITDGSITLQEGTADPVVLHSSWLQVSQLRFNHITYDKAPDQVQVDVLFETPSDLANTDASLSLHFTVSLRP